MQRPFGIVLIAIFSFVTGLLGVGVGFTLLSAQFLTQEVQLLAGLAITLGVLSFASAYGLWSFQSWAWGLTVILQVAGIIGSWFMRSMPPPYGSNGQMSAFDIGSTALSIVIVLYLLLPHVRRLYSSSTIRS